MAGSSTTAGTRAAGDGEKKGSHGGRRRPDGPPFRKPGWPKAYSFALVTGAFFLDERIEAKLDALLRDRNLDPQNP
ncbi:hypothetical protein KBX37_31600 [Micromonospora sp. U56]|uniref:hypothetical protein n=1 Tax=Micromonospora sp. U56 TaxID=2824900 RepID=UPI001B3892A1|nr:hypothetical protein [Micromonospora sp. U56]MBQ0897546.1 hypothetical protein [Micromonospora sp. U56]